MEYNTEYTASLEEFAGVLRQLTDVVSSLTQIEEQKAQAAANSRHSLMNSFLSPEQAQILKLRGLEQKRIKLAASLGWKDFTFRQILEQADDRQKEVLSPLFASLDTGTKRLADIRDSADRIIRLRLKELESALSTGGGGYDGSGSPRGDGASHFHDQYV